MLAHRRPVRSFALVVVAAAVVLSLSFALSSSAATGAAPLVGSTSMYGNVGANLGGQAEAFKTTASADGTMAGLRVYVDATAAAGPLAAGLYSDVRGNPGKLLASGSIPSRTVGAWNPVAFGATVAVTSGTTYWIAVLGPAGSGTLRFRDAKTQPSQLAKARSMVSLPANWTAVRASRDGGISAYSFAALDTAPPTTPDGLTLSGVSGAGVTLAWNPSTDDIGVAGYTVYLDGAKVGSTTSATSFSFGGLSCGTSYTVGVAANDDAGNASGTATTSVTTTACADSSPPSTPTNVAVSGVTPSQATLSWTASSDNVGVTGYRVFRDGSQVGSSSSTSYTFAGLSCGTSYALGVAAVDAAGNVSSTASGTVTTSACPDTTAPSTPTTLVTSGVTQTQVGLSWSASTDNVGVTGYKVSRNGTQVATPSGTSYTYTGLTCGTTYTLGVSAVDAAGNVSTAATTSVTTAGCPDTTAPSVPVGLLTSGVGQSSVGLSWNVSTDNVGVTGYRLFQNGTQVGTSVTPSYIFGGLSCGTSYTLGVAAYDAAGNVSAPAATSVTTSACADTTAPSAPAALVTSAVGQTSATLSWGASTDNVGVTGYRLFRAGTQVGTATTTSYTYTGLTCGTSYTLGVAAVDAAGNASTTSATNVTAAACASPPPPPPPSSGANVAVSTSGSDTTCVRGDLTKPCATLAKAYLVAQPGDVVSVAAGTYPFERIVKGSQSQAGPAITLQCATAHACTVNNVDLGQNNGSLSGDAPSYLTFDGIDVHGSIHSYYNQNADPQPTHITFKNGHVWSITSDGSGIMLNSPDSLTLQDMEIGPICCGGGGSGDDGFELGLPRSGAPSPSNIVLNRVYIHDLYDSCAHLPAAISSQYGTCSGTGYGDGCTSCDHVDGIQVYGAHGFLMQNSRIYAINPGYAVGQGLFMQEANGGSFTNVTLQNNMFASTPNNTVSMSGPGSGSWSGYLNVYYNTIQGNLRLYGSSGSQIFKPGTPITIAGNIIGNIASSNNNSCSIILSDNSTFTPTYSHNLTSNQKCSTADFQGNATFMSASGTTPNLHLSGAQTAVDNGDATYSPSSDIDGNTRPGGAAPDIGADETN